jgi:hypothetical protein
VTKARGGGSGADGRATGAGNGLPAKAGGRAHGATSVGNGFGGSMPRQQRLYFLALPQGHGSFRAVLSLTIASLLGASDHHDDRITQPIAVGQPSDVRTVRTISVVVWTRMVLGRTAWQAAVPPAPRYRT